MKMLKYYLAVSLCLAALTIYSIGTWFLLPILWITLSFFSVTFAYATNSPSVFRKKSTGKIPWYITWLFWPYLSGVHLYNGLARKRDTVDVFQPLSDNLFVACRLFPSDVDMLKAQGIEAILDVTAEFDGLNWSAEQQGLHYLNIPVLDHQPPTSEQLSHGIAWIDAQHKLGRKVVVHCALGRGRSVFYCAAYLLFKNKHDTVQQVLEQIQQRRESARLNKHQLKTLTKLHESQALAHTDKASLIINPVAGAKKWSISENEIIGLLTSKYHLTIHFTEADTDVAVFAKQILTSDKPNMVIAGGGDGTLAAVAHGIIKSDVKFGILPLGTANSLATVLLGPATKVVPISTSCEAILSGRLKPIDIMTCNDKTALLAAAIGFGEEMIEKADREQKNMSGQFAYIKSLLEAVSENKPLKLKVSFDGNAYSDIECVSLVVANAAPKTTILAQGHGEPIYDDGKLDVTILPFKPESAQSITVAELLLPEHDRVFSDIRVKQCEKINLEFEQEQNFALDGEILHAKSIEIVIQKHALNVMTPN
ncbi:diacylglycerol kinase family protein [Pseudoalteromonas phenolica]|uniref:diacylglycerol kinase family protein n=1 Tax=Pseudoalteromonas phenolica TaxID=161398 RepID=UPI00384D5827